MVQSTFTNCNYTAMQSVLVFILCSSQNRFAQDFHLIFTVFNAFYIGPDSGGKIHKTAGFICKAGIRNCCNAFFYGKLTSCKVPGLSSNIKSKKAIAGGHTCQSFRTIYAAFFCHHLKVKVCIRKHKAMLSD